MRSEDDEEKGEEEEWVKCEGGRGGGTMRDGTSWQWEGGVSGRMVVWAQGLRVLEPWYIRVSGS